MSDIERLFRPDQIDRLLKIAAQSDQSIETIHIQIDQAIERIEVDTKQDSAMEPWRREMRTKLYKMARDYWRQHNDPVRLNLTDTELDEQFWFIDESGIPRLHIDDGTFELVHDPIEDFFGIFSDNVTDLSITVRESVAAYFEEKNDGTD